MNDTTYSSIINAKTKENFHKNLYEHFSYLVDTIGFEPVLEAICGEAQSASLNKDILEITFKENMILSGELPADTSQYNDWPESFQKCVSVHESLYFPEKGWSIYLGKGGLFDPEYLDEDDDESDLLEYIDQKDVLSPIADYSDWWLYHPGHKNEQGEPSIVFFDHGGGCSNKPLMLNIGSLFLKRMAAILGLKVEIPEIYGKKVDFDESSWNWWNSLSQDWQTALKKCNKIKTKEISEKNLATIIDSPSFTSPSWDLNLEDLSPLSFLSKLKEIRINHQKKLSNISPLKNLTQLKSICLKNANEHNPLPQEEMELTRLAPLKDLVYLKELILCNMKIDTLSPLKNMINLKEITLSLTNIKDISPLHTLKNIDRLDCVKTNISFEQILYYATSKLDVFKNPYGCTIYSEDLITIDLFINAIEKIDFSLEECGAGLTALVKNRLISQLYGGNSETTIRLLKAYMLHLPIKIDSVAKEEFFSDCSIHLTRINNYEFTEEVFKNLFPEKITKSRTAFNLACFYSLQLDKEKLFKYMKLSLELGHEKKSFIKDNDFEYFQIDPDFIDILEGY